MVKISGLVIAKNEEKLIGGCLKSLAFCDEVIVLDGNSVDRTAAIAREAGARVIVRDESDFSKRRNRLLKEARNDWILYLDADERAPLALRRELEVEIRKARPAMAAYRIPRKNFYFGGHEWPKIEKIERLFKKEKLKKWIGKLHESPEVEGETGELKNFFVHYTHRDLASMLLKTAAWSKIEAENRFEAGHPRMKGWRFCRVMLTAFYDSFIKQGGWRVGTAGLVESFYQAFSMFVTYGRLWELQEKVKNSK